MPVIFGKQSNGRRIEVIGTLADGYVLRRQTDNALSVC